VGLAPTGCYSAVVAIHDFLQTADTIFVSLLNVGAILVRISAPAEMKNPPNLGKLYPD
jgi:hypothetical protein